MSTSPSDNGRSDSFDIVGAFDDTSSAKRAVEMLVRRGVTKQKVHLVPSRTQDDTRRAEMRAEMQDEVTHGLAGPGVSFMTPQQLKGAIPGAALGGLAGLALGLLVGTFWAYVVGDGPAIGIRLLLTALPFTAGGLIAGAILGGALKPRLHAARRPAKTIDQSRLEGETGPLVTVSVTTDPEARLAEEVLKDSGATRVDAISDAFPLRPGYPSDKPQDES